MFSYSVANLFSSTREKSSHSFPVKGQDVCGVIERVKDPGVINQQAAKAVLVESFISEYGRYLLPEEISPELVSWYEGERSVRQYYENYFEQELAEFIKGDLHYWVQATVNGQLAGWATFQREKNNPHEVYMNLLVVHPDFQQMGIGQQLVHALTKLQVIPALSAIHLLLRSKNQGGRLFYSKLGFNSDPDYQREDNFVDLDLLEGFTWKNPALQHDIESRSQSRSP